LKNSSKLEEKIERNFIFSKGGTLGSIASCKTLSLKANQLISLLLYFSLIFTFSFLVILYVFYIKSYWKMVTETIQIVLPMPVSPRHFSVVGIFCTYPFPIYYFC